jgi:phosphate transport system permease protein
VSAPATADSSTTAPTFAGISASRKIRNSLATVLVTAAFLLALVPLAWVLYTVFARGFTVILSAGWWS